MSRFVRRELGDGTRAEGRGTRLCPLKRQIERMEGGRGIDYGGAQGAREGDEISLMNIQKFVRVVAT